MLINRIVKFFTSLRLTVVLLAFGIILVFVGTVAQADEGLYQAQARYFRHWFVLGATMFGYKVPIALPGGYLIGTLLLINLIAAHIARFQFTTKKLGIHLTHLGVILLLAGQLATDLLSRETQMRFVEGESKTYSESGVHYELAFISDSDANTEEVVTIPDRLLATGGELKHERLPFTIRVKDFWKNSEVSFRAPMVQNGPPLTTNGIARNFDFHPVAETKRMDDKNVTTVIVELITPNGSLGTWAASGWAGDEQMLLGVRRGYQRQMGEQMAQSVVKRLTEPQVFALGGIQYTVILRPVRAYNPFSITLLKTTHTVYRGTDIPKDFRSRVRIQNPQKGEDREVEIFMNSPLRYAGATYYQLQMDKDEMAMNRGISVLQVVRNPSWLTPYAGCGLVAFGLVVQFMMHLVGFISKRRNA